MRKNNPDDIWKFIDKKGQNECWPYTGGTFNKRYGRFNINGKNLLAHKFVYELENGPVTVGLMVMHKCNNKLCCNPKHLILGTNQINQLHAVHSMAWKPGESGIMGVGFIKSRNYWAARCYDMGKSRNLYTGPSKEKAIAARKNWEELNLKFVSTLTTEATNG